MNILISKRGGYCYGVQRALKLAMEAAENSPGPVHTLGPIIHNPGVVRELAAAGVSPVETLADAGSGTIILRTHGVTPQVAADAEARGLRIVDATCPYVKVAQEKASLLKEQGFLPVILGEHEHPEVVALIANAGARTIVVEKAGELELSRIRGKKVGVVVQTTQASANLSALVSRLSPASRELLVYNTMCNATRKCQEEALGLARRADAVVVIGGRNSANTTRLAKLCREVQARTYHIEDVSELEPEWFAEADTVAITAGASTPPEQMAAVADWLQELSG
ncbi:MAG: 4-hydroxy-3-methylbut-2-enyl diphosphate reductase [Actinomycetota bacterium]|nr:4-hydroxy-3-methylbut-2-enyl diphosphate reductase [Actinomycetota bacterium]MCL6093643.1 4-hydroxy-3-methylbut-2-enyl diphosphate reductase [Actinomycetota bacterium]MDA8166782.1 4-hydroxy-3-methylbut-2-enyl diphosphate reductase [Actinomycetota bacterium]